MWWQGAWRHLQKLALFFLFAELNFFGLVVVGVFFVRLGALEHSVNARDEGVARLSSVFFNPPPKPRPHPNKAPLSRPDFGGQIKSVRWRTVQDAQIKIKYISKKVFFFEVPDFMSS